MSLACEELMEESGADPWRRDAGLLLEEAAGGEGGEPGCSDAGARPGGLRADCAALLLCAVGADDFLGERRGAAGGSARPRERLPLFPPP